MKTSFYQRQRGKFQQKPTKKRCVLCGAPQAENAHLVGVLTLRKLGVPSPLINSDFNLIPLCRPCHWLLDSRRDIWVNSQLKREGVKGRENLIMESFAQALQQVGYEICQLPEEYREEFASVDIPFLGDMEQVQSEWAGIGDKTYTIIKTKAGQLFLADTTPNSEREENEFIDKLQAIWHEVMEHSNLPSTAEWRARREDLQKQYKWKRQEVLQKLRAPYEESRERFNELIETHRKIVELCIGQHWATDEISGFDITTMRDGMIKVYVWK